MVKAVIQLAVASTLFILILRSVEVGAQKKLDPAKVEELCRNFTHGDSRSNEFFSPSYPRKYPPEITCFRVLTAEVGYFVRVDFREMFKLEPNKDCDYDFLEIRDGDQGYSPLIGKYCGDNFPPMITSSGRSLWLRFKSDATVEYNGFRAEYSFIENPLEFMPDIGKCEFEAGDFQDFIGSDNISHSRIEHSIVYDAPIDCVWTIQVDEGYKLYLQFTKYELKHPNDCHLNYLQVYDGKTDEENLLKKFCGSVAESITSKSNVVFVRFYAEKTGMQSKFSSVITAVRSLSTGASCNEDEYDCDDATCIHPDLVCNTIRNCKFGWDEEDCETLGSTISQDFAATHVILILVILSLILLGMFAGMLCNLYRKLSADKEEQLQKSMASGLNRVDQPDFGVTPIPILAMKLRTEEGSQCHVPGPMTT